MKKDLTEFCVYNAMIYFLYGYEKRRYGYGTLQEILCESSPLPAGGTSNPAIWAEWKVCVSKSLEKILEIEPSGQAALRVYTKLQAFNAMVDFFIDYYKRTLSGDLRVLMEVIYSLSDTSVDQAAWTDWNNAAKKALQKRAIEKPEDETMERRLTELQAFNTMTKFLDEYYEVTAFDFMGGLISSFFFLPDGGTADPAFWIEWDDAVKKVLQEQTSEKYVDEVLGISVTELQAFKTMVQFFKDYYERGPESGITIFFNYLYLLPDNSSGSSAIREKWKTCVDSAIKEKPGVREYLFP